MLVFSGNINLLVAAPMLQDAFVDKDGSPMAGGTVTCYHDNSRTTLKNWYYQVGSAGDYIYIALPNPLTLSAAGTICDINGVDTIPFFYPYDETDTDPIPDRDPYYITIVNYFQTNQITRENFPFLPSTSNSSTAVNTFNNLVINSGFWRNVQPNTTNITPYTSFPLDATTLTIPPNGTNYTAVVAPSQHDGFRMPDIQYQQGILTGNNVVTFIPFPLTNIQPVTNVNTVSPEYYINHLCNAPGTGQTQKCYQFPLSLHLNTLANLAFTFSIQAQNAGGTNIGENVISIYLLQDTGTGGTPVPPQILTTFTLNSSWNEYTFTDFFPATSGLNLGFGADDAWYLQVQMPLNSTCSINFTKPSIYLTENIVPTNDLQTYDQVDAIINSPRTGDLRISFNPFYNDVAKWVYGWVPMNNGTIGNAQSNALTRGNADCWRLYNMMWNFAKPYDTGATFNPISQMFNSAQTAINYGTSAISDFNAGHGLTLPQTLGRVMMGTVPISALEAGSSVQTVTASNPSGAILLFSCQNSSYLFQGQPITFSSTGTLPGNISANVIYYITLVNSGGANTFQVATTFANALSSTAITFNASLGTPIISIKTNLTGSITGEYGHLQAYTELVNHSHTAANPGYLFASELPGVGATAINIVAAAAALSLDNTTGGVTFFGAQSPFNIVQSATFYNIFIKL